MCWDDHWMLKCIYSINIKNYQCFFYAPLKHKLLNCFDLSLFQVLQLIMDISTTNPSASNNKDDADPAVVTFVTDICACCVEQGLVPQLEYIQQGIVIYYNPSTVRNDTVSDTDESRSQNIHTHSHITFCFPEESIRKQSTTLLHHLVQEVEKQGSLLTRLTSAMLHSGNTKLRVNIFSGLMYLTGRCPEIGRYVQVFCSFLIAEYNW